MKGKKVQNRLYLVTNGGLVEYGKYRSAVIATLSAAKARLIHPGGDGDRFRSSSVTWCAPEQVKVRYLGKAAAGISGVICADFWEE